MTYAADTSVPAARSRDEIERTLDRYGATQFMYAYDGGNAVVAFMMRERQIRFVVAFPDLGQFALTPKRVRRSAGAQKEAYDKAVRQRWRAMLLVIKGKLEAIETGIVDFETEFLAQTVLPNGMTVGDQIQPDIDHAYETNAMPTLLPTYNDRKAITT